MIHIERQGLPISSSPIFSLNVFLQWGFFVFVCFSAAWAQHAVIRFLASMTGLCKPRNIRDDGTESPDMVASGVMGERRSGTTTPGTAGPVMQPPRPPTPSAISTALFVSSCMSLFPILMIVWRSSEEPTVPGPAVEPPPSSFLPGILLRPGQGVGWVRRGVVYAVALQNLEALRILLGCGYMISGILVLTGGALRYVVRSIMLGLVGMNES